MIGGRVRTIHYSITICSCFLQAADVTVTAGLPPSSRCMYAFRVYACIYINYIRKRSPDDAVCANVLYHGGHGSYCRGLVLAPKYASYVDWLVKVMRCAYVCLSTAALLIRNNILPHIGDWRSLSLSLSQ